MSFLYQAFYSCKSNVLVISTRSLLILSPSSPWTSMKNGRKPASGSAVSWCWTTHFLRQVLVFALSEVSGLLGRMPLCLECVWCYSVYTKWNIRMSYVGTHLRPHDSCAFGESYWNIEWIFQTTLTKQGSHCYLNGYIIFSVHIFQYLQHWKIFYVDVH